MTSETSIIAIKIATHRDLVRILDEVKKGNVIIASFSAFRNIEIRRDIVRRILEARSRLNFNVLGVGSNFMIIAPSKVKIKIEDGS